MNKRIVITGLGVLSSVGEGREECWKALRQGRPGYQKITLFETDSFLTDMAAEISGFDAAVYLGKKGLRTLDRSTRLLVSASKLAMEDSGFQISDDNTDQCGVSVGTTMGVAQSVAEFDLVTLQEGPRYVNPSHFPNTVINSPASQVSIWNNIQGFSNTLSGGFTASLEALSYAADFIDTGRVQYVLAGGVEELSRHTFWGFQALKFLSASREGDPFLNCPFDRRRNGAVLGEGAVLVSMESYEHARARGARIMAEVVSFGYAFDPYRIHKYRPQGLGLKAAMVKALDRAGISPREIDCVFANANSTPAADRVEAAVIRDVFGARGKSVPVTATKSMTGECYSVSGAMAAAAALGTLETGVIPPTINYQDPDPDCDLNIIANHPVTAAVNTALVVNFSPSGSNLCVILRKISGEN